jgi:hypothetical protein
MINDLCIFGCEYCLNFNENISFASYLIGSFFTRVLDLGAF